MHLLSMSMRSWLVVGSAGFIACGALGVACSNGPGYNNDGGPDSGGGPDVKNDNNVIPDGSKQDGGGGDGALPPCATTALKGECDIVLQNCPSGKQCVVGQASDGGFIAQCQPNGGGIKPEGYACTDSTECLSGLECFTNRCSKHCCLSMDQECGTAQPEGFAGKCDLNIVDNAQTPMYAVCTYGQPCQPFQIQKCSAGLTCLLSQDTSGTADCYVINDPDGGKPEKAACTGGNECKDGLLCLSLSADAGSTCMWGCYKPPGPFDAGIQEAGAGKGGCPSNETCTAVNWGGTAPTWLAICK